MDQLSSWLVAGIFAAAAAVIWWAGVQLEHLADTISVRTGWGRAFTGGLLLATATSLPEVATTVTAVVAVGSPTLAVYNMLGGVALQTVLLVFADWRGKGRGALTSFSPRFVLLIQGVGLVLLLQVAMTGVSARGVPSVFGVSVWTFLVVVMHLGTAYLAFRHRGHPRWTPTQKDDVPKDAEPPPEKEDGNEDSRSMGAVWALFAGASALVVVAGWFVTQAADALAHRTGLGPAFLGATLLALATSLPELSTTLSASRNGRYTTAISNIFGSNSFDVSLIFLADVLYRDASILQTVTGPVVFVTALGSTLTCIYLLGLLEREDRTVLKVGWDSAAVFITYLAGMVVLYFLR